MGPPRILPQSRLLSTNTNFGYNYKSHNSSCYEKSAPLCSKTEVLSDHSIKRVTFLQCKKPIERTTFQTLRKYKNKQTTAQKLTNFVCHTKLSSKLNDILDSETLGSLDVKTPQNPPKGDAREQNPTNNSTGHTLLRTTAPDSRNCELAESFSATGTLTVEDRSSVAFVREFLDGIRLLKYVNKFEFNGILTDLDLQLLEENDLEMIGIQSKQDRELILKSVSQFLSSERVALFKWLQMYQLGELWNQLWSLGIQSLSQLFEASSSSRDQLESLGVRTYGAQKRFKLCCQSLESYLSSSHAKTNDSSQSQTNLTQIPPNSHQPTDPKDPMTGGSNPSSVPDSTSEGSSSSSKLRVSEKTVAVGYWAKPQSLKGATSDFLCVQAALRGTSDVTSPAYQLEFMVDSGSDVVTCRPEVLQKLGVKLLGRIESRGIHATVEKEIYRGYLQLGGQVVPVEVMPESYESIGNQVMKHFKHYITNNNHFWLTNQQQQ